MVLVWQPDLFQGFLAPSAPPLPKPLPESGIAGPLGTEGRGTIGIIIREEISLKTPRWPMRLGEFSSCHVGLGKWCTIQLGIKLIIASLTAVTGGDHVEV